MLNSSQPAPKFLFCIHPYVLNNLGIFPELNFCYINNAIYYWENTLRSLLKFTSIFVILTFTVFNSFLAQQTPYSGTPAAIPGRIIAADFDNGGEGIAFHDADPENQGGAYRPDSPVDIEPASEGGYNVGWIEPDEWLEYTVDVANTDEYFIRLRVASESTGGAMRVEVDEQDLTGSVNLPVTGGWQVYTTVQINKISLEEGEHIMRFYFETGGFNVLHADFSIDNSVLLKDLPNGPEFSVEHGFYDEPFDLVIADKTLGSVIKYTLDGTDPVESNSAFTGNSPVELRIDPDEFSNRDRAPGVVVRACALLDGVMITQVKSQSYIFTNKVISNSPDGQRPGSDWLPVSNQYGQSISYGMDPAIYNNSAYMDKIEEGLKQIPSMSLVIDLDSLFGAGGGIYYEPNSTYHGIEWERTASLELLIPEEIDLEDHEGFSVNCGVRIRGGWSRNASCPKRAFRFFFREEYGYSKLEYPLFGEEGTDRFDKFDLRTSMNYSWAYDGSSHNTMLREVFSRDLQREMGQPYTRSRYYHLYINGTYWGLYQTQERSEASFAAEYLGGERDDYDVVKVNAGYGPEATYDIESTDGTLDAWRRLWELATYEGFESNENYFKVQGLNTDGTLNPEYEKLLDVDNLIDYMIIVFFVGDFDAPVSAFSGNNNPNNYYAVYNRNNPDGFKFFRHDAEHSMYDYSIAGISLPNVTDRTGPYPAGSRFEKSNPQWIHQQLVENANYRKRFADRVSKYFYNDGILTLDNMLELVNSRKNKIDMAIIAESARWGDSKVSNPYTKNHWDNAVNYLLNDYLPERSTVVINQLKSKGWLPNVEPPVFNTTSGTVDKGFNLTIHPVSGGDVYYSTNGTDVYELSGANSSGTYQLVEQAADKKVLIPSESISNDWYRENDFNDAGWMNCTGSPGGIGYERDEPGNYGQFISLNVRNIMMAGGSSPNTSCLVRIPFTVAAEDLQKINRLVLSALYDDDFIVYLNGTAIRTGGRSIPLAWNANASDNHEAESWESFDVSSNFGKLVAGENLLAVHALNVSLESSDFLINVKLTGESNITGGELTESAIRYDNPIVIEEPVRVIARTFKGQEWSAMNEVTLAVDEDFSNLFITELHYHPLDEDGVNDSEFEFIEFKNTGDTDINLSQVSFVNGISYTFPTGTVINPDSFIVLASNSQSFEQRYGFNPDGEYEGQFNNGGERITIETFVGDTLINFNYNDSDPWPVEADGLGYSLVSRTINPVGDPDDAEYWTTSAEIHGSPGQDEINITILPVYINEVLSHTDAPDVDAIEIYNPNTEAVNIGGWYLTDDKFNPLKWRIPDGKTVSANGYLVFTEGHYIGDELVFDEDEFGSEFSINSHEEMIYIVSSDGSGNQTGYRHGFEFGEIENGFSFGRYINSIEEEHFVIQKEVTLGSENAGPKVGPVVINRIMYNPDFTNYEFLEITNINGVAVNLYHPDENENTWRINGTGFEFPELTTIEPNESIYIIDSNVVTEVFRKAYELGDEVKIFNMPGSLDNGGETISIQMPVDEFDLDGETIVPYIDVDKVKYNDKIPWPEEADGDGPGLERIEKNQYANDPVNWTTFESQITDTHDRGVQIPSVFKLNQNYPNPFNPSTSITYSVPEPVMVSIKVYNLLGEEAAVLVNEYKNTGNYKVEWNASSSGSEISSGVYLYKMNAGKFVQTKKLILVK